MKRSCACLMGTLLTIGALTGENARGQGAKADYERADGLRARFANKLSTLGVRPRWTADGNRFWFRVDQPDGKREYTLVIAATGEKRPLFDATKLAEALAKETGKPVAGDRLSFDRIDLGDDGSIIFEFEGKGRKFDPQSGALKEGFAPAAAQPDPQPSPRGPQRRNRSGFAKRTADSPDGKWTVAIRDHNVWLKEKSAGAGGDGEPVSFEGSPVDAYETGMFWSPDSKKFVALRLRQGDAHRVNLIESSPKDQLQPKLSGYDYLKPGDHVPISKPHLFSVELKREIPIDDALFENPWSIEDYRWAPDSSRFTFLFNQRGHQALRIIAVDSASGEPRAIVDEQSKTFIDYAHKTFAEYLDKTHELIWMSERDGWNHLYLYDLTTGSVKSQITKGEWLVRAVDRVDVEKRQVWFRAGGIRPDQDPYYVHYARVNFDGSGLTVLTAGDGTHTMVATPDGRYVIDTYSRADLAPVTELRRGDDGAPVVELHRTSLDPLLKEGWVAPERFVAKGRDGATDIYGLIYRPTTFDPWRKYPVIEAIYAGPQGQFVPKGFAPVQNAMATAELGFVVVQIDGMGTNWRSKAFHNICWKNLADAGFPDRILWIKAAAKKYPSLDLERIGLYGGSAGGQNALGGLLFHPEFYKVGAADCGCHDNRMDKIWWNELWMGWPIGPHYAEQSNVTNAHKLEGKLLLTVGELDHNVDPASTMQVVNALIKANKDFELIVFPGADHGAGGSPYGRRRLRDFFVRNLLGVEPRAR